MNELRLQEPSSPSNWLYEETSINERNFAKSVYLGANADPWVECTNEEQTAWEDAHKQEEPIEVEQ
jgi:hypothetical protein